MCSLDVDTDVLGNARNDIRQGYAALSVYAGFNTCLDSYLRALVDGTFYPFMFVPWSHVQSTMLWQSYQQSHFFSSPSLAGILKDPKEILRFKPIIQYESTG